MTWAGQNPRTVSTVFFVADAPSCANTLSPHFIRARIRPLRYLKTQQETVETVPGIGSAVVSRAKAAM
jgi:hypothetical protein